MVTESKTKKIPILMYHSIAEQASEKFRPFTLSPALFADHVAYLLWRGYTPITVSQFIEMRHKNTRQSIPERPVILTFDDGFADFFSAALPVLQRYHFPATIYIATAYMNGTSHWLKRSGESSRRMLRWEQVREIDMSGIECGAHSHHHLQLDTLSYTEAREEIISSKQLLEEHLEKPVVSFAYPHGYHSMALKQIVREVGFTSACTVKYTMCGMDNDRFALPRLFVSSDTNVEKLEALLAQPVPSSIALLYGNAKAPLWRLVRRCSAPVQETSR
jgi:peptidoglycan/xylan/chitin deacetylase (PgdA/CDA1 family)